MTELRVAVTGPTGDIGRSLLRALERFDPNMGTPFWAYASWWVRQAMQQLVSELTRPVVLSDRALRQLAQLKEAHREFQRTYGQEPTIAHLVERTGVDGFNLAYAVMPETFADFVDLVVPELQRRGRYKLDYAPGTLREKLYGPGRARLGADHPAASFRGVGDRPGSR